MWELIFNFVVFHPEIAILGAITLVEVAPIKLDPWSAIGRMVRRAVVGDIDKKLDSISKKVNQLEDQFAEDKAIRARAHILRFADGIYNGKHHLKEYYDDILDDIDMYEKYCEAHPKFKNNKTIMSVELIKNTYHDRFMVTPTEQ